MGVQLLEQDKKDFVRISIGNAKTGQSGMRKPTKTISITGISVDKVYKFFIKAIKEGELK